MSFAAKTRVGPLARAPARTSRLVVPVRAQALTGIAAKMPASSQSYHKLAQILSGMSKRTPRASISNTRLVSADVSTAARPWGNSRCEKLTLSLEWEVTPTVAGADPSTPISGLAHVSLASVDEGGFSRDVVRVEVDQGSVKGPAELLQTSDAKKLGIRDVLYAVQSLDSEIMTRLNDWMWEVEQASGNGSDASGLKPQESMA